MTGHDVLFESMILQISKSYYSVPAMFGEDGDLPIGRQLIDSPSEEIFLNIPVQM